MAARENPLPSLKVVQAVCGTFHHFDLARELDARGLLECIYSTFPWWRLRREGVDRGKVRTFPWIHTPQLLLGRRWKIPDGVNRDISWAMFRSFDAWTARTLPRCDVFVGISGTGLKTGRRAQQRGGKYVCDRGSSHIRYQDRILREEYGIWGVEREVIVDPRMITREEAEYEEADAITVPSEFARRSFVEMGVPPEKLHRIPYGVRLERFRRVGEPPKDRFEVLFAGAVSLRKGVPYLLEAFAKLRHPRKRLRIAGGMDPLLQKLLPRLPQEGVEFLGPLPQDELARVMSSSHVMVLPSIEEGLALVQAQALACGCPLVSSQHTGGEDLFTDGVEGSVVPIRSPEAIVERLQQLAEDPALRQRMSEAALERVRHIGGWREYGERWAELLRQLTAA